MMLLFLCVCSLTIVATESWLPEIKKKIVATKDEDGTGSLSMEEFRKAIRRSWPGSSLEMINEVMLGADTNGSGKIEFEEFCGVIAYNCDTMSEKKKRKASQGFYPYENDILSADQLRFITLKLNN